MNPIISIILPFYNAEHYIAQTIDSIINQTFDKYELILVDDGSVDGSVEVVKHILTNRGGVKILNQSNKGVSSARNLGLTVAIGVWITFIDGDDLIAPDYLEQLYNETVKCQNADLIQSGIINLYENGDTNREQEYQDKISNDSTYIFSNVRGLLHGKLFKRDTLNQNKVIFNDKLKLCEDIVFTTQYLLYANIVKFSSYNGYYYRRHHTSATGGAKSYAYNIYLETAESIGMLYKRYCSTKKIPIPDKHKKTIASKYWSLILSLYKTRVKKEIRLRVLKQIVGEVDNKYLALLDLSLPQKSALKLLLYNFRIFDTIMLLSGMGYRLIKK